MTMGIVIHFLLALVLTWQFIRQEQPRDHVLAVLLLTVFFPIGGPLIVFFVYLLPVDKSGDVTDFEAESILNQDAVFSFVHKLDIGKETDIAPLEDSLMLADRDLRRKLVLNTLKKNEQVNASLIRMALRNDDSETAHYAASSILQVKRRFDTRINELSAQYEQEPSNQALAKEYADVLKQYIDQVDLDPAMLSIYRHKHLAALQRIVGNQRSTDAPYMIRMIELLLMIGKYQEAKDACQRLQDQYPESEDKYVILLKAYFTTKDKQRFYSTLNRFMSSGITFSSETMNIVRLWRGAIEYENQ